MKHNNCCIGPCRPVWPQAQTFQTFQPGHFFQLEFLFLDIAPASLCLWSWPTVHISSLVTSNDYVFTLFILFTLLHNRSLDSLDSLINVACDFCDLYLLYLTWMIFMIHFNSATPLSLSQNENQRKRIGRGSDEDRLWLKFSNIQ